MQDIIPFDSWINSQLSVARHYGSIKINDKTYIIDYIFCKEEANGLCKPDLVEEKLYKQMQKDRKKEVKAYNDEVKKRTELPKLTWMFIDEANSLPF